MTRCSWLERSAREANFRLSSQYNEEVKNFINLAFSNGANIGQEILCPCVKCRNRYWYSRDDIEEHLVVDGFVRGYTEWTYHGESSSSPLHHHGLHPHEEAVVLDDVVRNDQVHNMIEEMQEGYVNEGVESGGTSDHAMGSDLDIANFERLMKDAEQELYAGCKGFTKLRFILRLYHIKCLCKLSDKAFAMLLELLKEALPKPNSLPNSLYETKKIVKGLGLDYERIDACPRDCMLFWKEAVNDDSCHKCGTSRYKPGGKKIPVKTLRHFPLIPRLQRLYMSSKTSAEMRWHHEQRADDGRLRHPADSKAWKEFDNLYPDFGKEPRNVRLGLASDGFNPFGMRSSNHSTWPVVLIPYNLPPWLCMKAPNMILTLLIPGPKQPGNDIDIYLQPLIEELKILWDTGVATYDVYEKETFNMHASLLWTINDFPAYGNLSGWSTKGALACPVCNKDSSSRWLKNGKKHCYMGHRRFLHVGHSYRRNKKSFDGHEEKRVQPKILSGNDVLEQMWGVQFPEFGKEINAKGKIIKRKSSAKDCELPLNWKKRSIFFYLPYWRHNLIRHNLDVMHIEKNVCDNIIFTLLNVKDRGKDNLKARQDLKDMNIRAELHPKILDGGKKMVLPPTHYTMSNKDKESFCRVLSGVKVPDGYAGNIRQCVEESERMISRMKSHDCHILMQQLLPVAVRNVLPKSVVKILVKFCGFFRDLCSNIGTEEDFRSLGDTVAITMCNLEKLFPPNFFDVMVHLVIHLGHKASLAGPVHYRWMYPIERFLKQLKDYVRNRSRPEGSIAEGYIADECLIFCSRYFEGIETRTNRPMRNRGSLVGEDPYNIFSGTGRPLGKREMIHLDIIERKQIQRYVLFHYEGIEDYRKGHRHVIKRGLGSQSRPHLVDKLHNKDFPDWFYNHILKLRTDKVEVPEHIRWLANGPRMEANSYSGYIINGIRFLTKERESSNNTQNSGILVTAMTNSFASRKDKQPKDENVDYYGVLTQVIEVEYSADIGVVLFRCDWVDPRKGVEKDEMGFKCVNFKRLLYSGQFEVDEPFVFPSQVEQVFYVEDHLRSDWHVAVRSKIQDNYNMGGHDQEAIDLAYTQSVLQPSRPVDPQDDDFPNVSYVRSDMPGILVDISDDNDGSNENQPK